MLTRSRFCWCVTVFTCAILCITSANCQDLQPIPGRPWTTIIPDPDSYDWGSNDRPGYRYRGMTAEQRRFYDYIERKRANAEPLSWAERAMIRRLIAVRRWPEAPRPNKFWAGYMRYLRSLPNDDLNTAQTLLLTELTRRGLVVMDRDTNQAVTRLREFLNSGQFEPRNWFEQAFGRAEGWMRGWLDYQLASHGHPLGTPGGDDEFPLQAFGEYRLDYSISGCSLEPHGKYSYRGTFSPGKPVTIRGRVRVGG